MKKGWFSPSSFFMLNLIYKAKGGARMKIKVLLADDHCILRQALRYLLESTSEIEVVGEAQNGKEAVGLASSLKPDVVLMDIAMPVLNGIDAAYEIKKKKSEIKVLILSMYATEEYAKMAIKAGVDGYISKDISSKELMEAIRAVYKGEIFLQADLASELIENCFGELEEEKEITEKLTSQEKEIIYFISKGLTNKEIASQLNIAPSTVKYHRNNIMKKLKVHDRAELVRNAIRLGLIQP